VIQKLDAVLRHRRGGARLADGFTETFDSRRLPLRGSLPRRREAPRSIADQARRVLPPARSRTAAPLPKRADDARENIGGGQGRKAELGNERTRGSRAAGHNRNVGGAHEPFFQDQSCKRHLPRADPIHEANSRHGVLTRHKKLDRRQCTVRSKRLRPRQDIAARAIPHAGGIEILPPKQMRISECRIPRNVKSLAKQTGDLIELTGRRRMKF